MFLGVGKCFWVFVDVLDVSECYRFGEFSDFQAVCGCFSLV